MQGRHRQAVVREYPTRQSLGETSDSTLASRRCWSLPAAAKKASRYRRVAPPWPPAAARQVEVLPPRTSPPQLLDPQGLLHICKCSSKSNDHQFLSLAPRSC